MAYQWQNVAFSKTAGAVRVPPAVYPVGEATTNVFATGPFGYDPANGCGFTQGTSAGWYDLGADGAINWLLGGSTRWVSATRFQHDVAHSGPVDFRLALDPGQAMIVLEGSDELINREHGRYPNSFWKAGTQYNLTVYVSATEKTPPSMVVSAKDPAIWTCVQAGVSGNVEPNGGTAGSTFVDGTVIWKRHDMNVLAALDGKATGTGSLVNANNAVVTPAAWAATAHRRSRISGKYGNAYTVQRYSTATPFLRTTGVRFVAAPLVDVALYSEFGDAMGPNPTIYCGQPKYSSGPDGRRIFRIAPSSGLATAAAFTLSGALAPYFRLIDFRGGVWAVQSDTMMPDSVAGASRTLGILQTDPDSTNGTHATTVVFNVVSSQGKPTDQSLHGRISTETWLNRAKVKAKHASPAAYNGQPWLWQGQPDGVPIAQVFTFAGANDMRTQLASFVPDGSSHYVGIVGAGGYTGDLAALAGKNFGTGSFRLTRATGVDPGLAMTFSGLLSGVQFDDLTLLPVKNQYTFQCPATATPPYGRVKVSNSRIGNGFAGFAATSDANIALLGYGGFATGSGQSFEIAGCDIDTVNQLMLLQGTFCVSFHDNRVKRIVNDIFHWGLMNTIYSRTHNFDEQAQYIDRYNNLFYAEPDFAGIKRPHSDDTQNPGLDYTVNKRSTGAARLPLKQSRKGLWVVGEYGVNAPGTINGIAYPGEVFEVAAVAVNAGLPAGVTGPSLAGPVGSDPTSFVDGGVTWKRLSPPLPYDGDGVIYINHESDHLMSASPNSVGGVAANRNETVDGTVGLGWEYRRSKFDVFNASTAANGLDQPAGQIWTEFCTTVGPADMVVDTAYVYRDNSIGASQARFAATSSIMERGCIIGGKGRAGNRRSVSYNGYAINFGSKGVDPNAAPGGPFVLKTGAKTSFWTYPQLPQEGALSKDAYVAQLRTIMQGLAGAPAGAGILGPGVAPPVPTTPSLSVDISVGPYIVGSEVNFTVKPNLAVLLTNVTGTATGGTGEWDSRTVSMPAGLAGNRMALTPTEAKTYTVTFDNDRGYGNPSEVSFDVVAPPPPPPWVPGSPIRTTVGGAVLTYGNRPAGLALRHGGPGVVDGIIVPDNDDPTAVTMPLKGPNAPAENARVVWYTEVDIPGGGTIRTEFARMAIK